MARAGRAPSISCPVARLAEEAAAIIEAMPAVEGDGTDNSAILWERINAIAEEAAYTAPRSRLGAYFQMLLLGSEIEPAATWVLDNPETRAMIRRLRRFSSFACEFMAVGLDPATAATLRNYYMFADFGGRRELDRLIIGTRH